MRLRWKQIEKIKRNNMKLFSYIWQLPQNLLGLLLRAYCKGNDKIYKDVIVRKSNVISGGISLGRYIIVNPCFDENVIKHEYGHSVQSKYFLCQLHRKVLLQSM